MAEKQHVWELCRTTPLPVGFDPAPIYGSVDSPGFGVLKFTPWRIEVDTMPALPELPG